MENKLNYEPTIGLEIHVELKTKSKMFCSCKNNPDETTPNTNVCPICMGHPGTLPTINEEAIRQIIRVGLALNCEINEHSKFDRKSYFYPDLPKGYQISQYDMPICKEGKLNGIRIERIHMEEDAGTLKHEGTNTLVDYNRAGVPLMELVTKPDITSGEQISKFAKELQLILRYLGASDADMEKGQMRVEVNISLNMGTKVEVKNINSISAAVKTAEYEFKRQTEILEKGGKIIQETRGWDDVKNRTVSQRIKEGSADYRYFPEPDLPPMRFVESDIEALRVTLPELPVARRERFTREYGIAQAQTEIFTVSKELGDYFEEVASELGDAKNNVSAANYIITELPPPTITPENFAELIAKISRKELSSSAAKTVLKEMATTGSDPDEIMARLDLGQVSDVAALSDIVDDIISANPKAVEDIKKGKTETMKFLVGKVMAASKGKANPQVALELLQKKLQ